MLEELTRPGLDGVSVSALDRLMRPDNYDLSLFQHFANHRKVIVSKREGLIEPWTPQGWSTIFRAMQQAGQERFDIRERSTSGRESAHALKKACNTHPPYGMLYIDRYSKDADGKAQYFTEDKTEAIPGTTKRQVVVMVFDWRWYNKLSIAGIKKRLNKMGILTAGKRNKDGSWQYEPGAWSRQTVIQLLRNRHYIGEHWEGGVRVDVECPTFIARDVFDGVQGMAQESREATNGRPAIKHLLCTFLRCKWCGRRMRTRTQARKGRGRGHYGAYICSSHDNKLNTSRKCRAPEIACHKLDPIVWGTIWRHLTQPAILLANAQAYYDSLPAPTGMARMERELADHEAKMALLSEMVYEGRYNKVKGYAKIDEHRAAIAELRIQLRAMGSVMTLPPLAQMEAACREIADGPEPGSDTDDPMVMFNERRPILEKLVNLDIRFGDAEVVIEGKVPVAAQVAGSSRQNCKGRVHGHYSSVVYIPFKIKERAA